MTDEEREEEREETGWKLVHADVFRPPLEHPMLFCVSHRHIQSFFNDNLSHAHDHFAFDSLSVYIIST